MSGYSGTPLWKKLGYKSGQHAIVVNSPKEYFTWLAPLPENVDFKSKPPFDIVHIFVNDTVKMENYLVEYQQKIVQNGMIWVSWYKKASKKPTTLNEDIIRNTALALKLVDIKVCSVNENWSALKMVIPVKYRT